MQQLVLPVALVLAFVAAAALLQGVAGAFLGARERNQRINRRLTMLNSGMEQKEVYEALVRRPAAPRFESQFLLSIFENVSRRLQQADIRTPLPMLAGYTLGVSLTVGLLSVLARRSFGVTVGGEDAVLSFVGAILLGFMVLWVWVNMRHAKRLKQIEAQLPLALDIIIRGLRAGHPVITAVQLVVDEMGDPIGTEFGLIVDETTYGYEFREALANFARRTGSEDAHFFAVSMAIQSTTGGNLAEILGNLATVIRSRASLGKRIRSLGSEGRMSALLLSFLPAFLISFMFLTQPKFYTEKFSDPLFFPIVGFVVVLYCIGQYAMHRIVNFKY